MKRINPRTQKVVTGVDLHLSNDDATRLSYALRGAIKLWKQYGYNGIREWSWLVNFVSELDDARGTGCTMGPRVRKT